MYEVSKDSAKKQLFDDRKDRLAEPDIVISETASRMRLVLEVKYKEKPNRDDINQTITYALSYRTRDAVLLHLAKTPERSGLYTIGVISGIKIYGYAYDLGSPALEDQELELTRVMTELFSPTAYAGPSVV